MTESQRGTGPAGGPGQEVPALSLGFATDLMIRRLAGSTVDDRGPYLVVRTPANPTYPIVTASGLTTLADKQRRSEIKRLRRPTGD